MVAEVPNLQSRSYSTDINGNESYFTAFTVKFSLRKAVSQTELFPELQKAALEFQANYGDVIKNKEELFLTCLFNHIVFGKLPRIYCNNAVRAEASCHF
jgi:hypothetical protein